MCKRSVADKKTTLEKLAVWLVFAVILAVGLLTFRDYGLSCDEQRERQTSQINYRSAVRMLTGREAFAEAGPPLAEYRDKYYGVAMQLPLVFAEDMYMQRFGAPMPERTVYLMRHLYTFLVYYAALVCFYFLNKQLFHNRWIALAGVLTVFLFGRFFAHAFYNIKDMMFVSLFVIALSCAERIFSTGRKPLWCILFAVSGALLVTSRVVGALLIVLVLVAMLVQDLLSHRRAVSDGSEKPPRAWKRLLPYLLICCAFPVWIVLTPASWSDPVGFSLGYVNTFVNFQAPEGAAAVAQGAAVAVKSARGYFVTWMTATLPVVVQVLSVLGVAAFVGTACSKRRRELLSDGAVITLILALLTIAATLGYQALAQPNVYDGWRHAYYLYPLIVLFLGFLHLWVMRRASGKKWLWLRAGLICAVAGSLAFNAVRIVKNHPYEYAMFNLPSRSRAASLGGDYWRLSYTESARWVLNNDKGALAISYVDPTAGKNWIVDTLVPPMLTEDERARITFCPLDEADYVLQNYWGVGGNEWPMDGFCEVHAVYVDGAKIAAVMKRLP